MNHSRFDYLLKSYCRESNYSTRQVSSFLGITHAQFLKYINLPIIIPEIEVVELVIKRLNIPKNLVWTSYFNSLHELFYSENKVILTDYDSYEKMIWSNKKKRTTGSIPSDEVFLELMDDFSLNGLTLADKFRSSVDIMLKGYKRIKEVSKEYNLSEALVKKIIAGKIITIKEFTELVFSVSMRDRGFYVGYYINSIIKIKKLPYKVLAKDDDSERLLLDRIYSQLKK